MSRQPRRLPLPMTPDEVAARGWDAVDVVFVTGDAYVDHPSFAMALLGRLLEEAGYRVAILSQPDWRSCDAWRTFGRPRLCFAVSAGNMDSMINHYTAARKVRNDDAYSPGGQIGLRPDRATGAYCQRAREAYKGTPVIAGGIEASLRRLAHYDYWSDKVRRSILMDAKPDLVVFGMGERTLVQIIQRLDAGESIRDVRDLPGVAYRLGANEPPPTVGVVLLPDFEAVSSDRHAFAEMTRLAHLETNPGLARPLVQMHGREAVVVNRPPQPLSEAEMDHAHGLPYTRCPHPNYGGQRIPAYEVVRDSVQAMRGCFGGCTFCSITAHEGRVVQSRSEQSVLDEIRAIAATPGFKGVISNIGGPSANMYRMNCSRAEVQARCRRPSCLHPTICKLLNTDHGPMIRLLKAARRERGVKQVFVASGIRTDLAQRSGAYLSNLARHHVGGHLKVAPEHVDPNVLHLMRKPPIEDYQAFARTFSRLSTKAGKKQYLVPYLIAGHPGSDLASMVEVALFLKRTHQRVEQVQDFIPGPFDVATCMYHTGIDPSTGREVYVAKGARPRRLQHALLQFSKPENYRDVREALEKIDRGDLIGSGADCLIAATPPERKRVAAARGSSGRSSSSSGGYRPHRKSKRRK